MPHSYIVDLKDGVSISDRMYSCQYLIPPLYNFYILLTRTLGDAHILALEDIIKTTKADAEVVHSYSIGSCIGFSARLTQEYEGK